MRCRWYKDPEGGRYLVPGCWNRAVHGDNAACQCVERGTHNKDQSIEERVSRIEQRLQAIEKRLAKNSKARMKAEA